MCIIEFLNDYNGALMVIITTIYVVATIIICIANYNSAKATREQLKESKHQYEDTRRLSMMPYLQAETASGLTDYGLKLALKTDDLDGGTYVLKIQIKNIGNGTAKDIRYKWNNFTESYDQGDFPIRALQSGDRQSISISFAQPRVIADYTMASFDLTYEDLLENTYTQRLMFCFEKSQTGLRLKNHAMCPPYVVDKENTNA